jgi:hypothetical protein
MGNAHFLNKWNLSLAALVLIGLIDLKSLILYLHGVVMIRNAITHARAIPAATAVEVSRVVVRISSVTIWGCTPG